MNNVLVLYLSRSIEDAGVDAFGCRQKTISFTFTFGFGLDCYSKQGTKRHVVLRGIFCPCEQRRREESKEKMRDRHRRKCFASGRTREKLKMSLAPRASASAKPTIETQNRLAVCQNVV